MRTGKGWNEERRRRERGKNDRAQLGRLRYLRDLRSLCVSATSRTVLQVPRIRGTQKRVFCTVVFLKTLSATYIRKYGFLIRNLSFDAKIITFVVANYRVKLLNFFKKESNLRRLKPRITYGSDKIASLGQKISTLIQADSFVRHMLTHVEQYSPCTTCTRCTTLPKYFFHALLRKFANIV